MSVGYGYYNSNPLGCDGVFFHVPLNTVVCAEPFLSALPPFSFVSVGTVVFDTGEPRATVHEVYGNCLHEPVIRTPLQLQLPLNMSVWDDLGGRRVRDGEW